ncbi:hypothetical protein GKD59_21675 [Parabacteroides distasonis]|uniref:Uncharacterized protein n=2 Tax=Pseudomonadati TaxID=3379134 RepID=A0A7K0GN48_PARDI|nr:MULTISPECIES: hypothetical protein [Bacteria]KAB5323527.1 hypothetical protein F9951_18425 [Bacteroides stercoris]MRY60462.1 hypothetical protein [Parabacteroides distasonis]MTU02779.1 hypothetical protein [Parasutterella excrementihominis]MTU24541.1 hypothetical protein [Parasutterella excrementihominis]MTU33757.1 hypothetical protein [Parasutterella excrementihominis]
MEFLAMGNQVFFGKLLDASEETYREYCKLKSEEEGLTSYSEPNYEQALGHARERVSRFDSVLMTAEKPEGFKLEELLARLQSEIISKTQKIQNDGSDVAEFVKGNNLEIIRLLSMAEALQRSSYVMLSAKAPDQGPLGKPRIGEPDSIDSAVENLRDAIQACEQFGRVFCRKRLNTPFQVTGAIVDGSGDILIVEE